jgi:hypothetical protein
MVKTGIPALSSRLTIVWLLQSITSKLLNWFFRWKCP